MSEIKAPAFKDTAEQSEKLQEVIAKYKGTEGALIPVLHEAQSIYGYLPYEVQKKISEGLDIPMAEIYGVVTFYTQFSIYPKGQFNVAVCLGTACYVKGGQNVIDKFADILKIKPGETTEDGLFTLDALRCIGACGIAPAISINGKVYPKVALADCVKIVNEYKNK